MKKKRFLKLVTIGMGFFLAGSLYALFVETTGWGLPCLFHVITGLYCPGCGVTHMCIALLHLDFITAAKSNVMVLCLLPVLLVLFLKNAVQYVKEGSYQLGKAENFILTAGIILLVGFGILRNILHFLQ